MKVTTALNAIIFSLGLVQAEEHLRKLQQRQGKTTIVVGGTGKFTILQNGTQYVQVLASNGYMRFSQKVAFPPNVITQAEIDAVFPLDNSKYPMNADLAVILAKANCPSVVLPNDYECVASMEEMVLAGGGEPPHAPDAAFWPFFEEVALYQIQRRANENALGRLHYPWLPILWQNFTVKDVAEAVHDEFPGTIQEKLLASFVKQGIRIDNNIIPKRSTKQFLHGPVLYANLNTWSVDMVAPTNFATKYHIGRARPEEVAISIHCSFFAQSTNTGICAGKRIFDASEVPQTAKNLVQSMALTKMEAFTGYPEGCPMHPSWPAMHSAASSLSLWLAVVADLTGDKAWMFEEAIKTDFATSWACTVAGVHYRDDNIAGLKIGQEIIARELPTYLASKYGADPIKVRAKLAQWRFDWEAKANQLLGANSSPA